MIHLNVLSQCTPTPLFEGLWRYPGEQSSTGYKQLSYWIEVAQRLEAACIDALFFADIHGIYSAYQNSWKPAVRHAMQVPALDPVPLVSALAAVTKSLGLAVTYSTSYHPPYQCARLFTTLDHLSGGRIGWNIVTSDLRLSAGTGMGDFVEHNQRYDRADEYLEVVRSLWERSWDDGAILLDTANDVFTDASRVRAIDHRGRWFTVTDPHQCEPSPQRTPVLYQAGASARGTLFAARHAEVVFIMPAGMQAAASSVAALRARAAELGRDPASIKVLAGMPAIIGQDSADARAKAELFMQLTSRDGKLAKWCGWVGVDLAAYPADAPIGDVVTHDGKSILSFLERSAPDKTLTVADLRAAVSAPRRPHRYDRVALFGTPSQIADRIEEWIERTGIDGFNLFPLPPSAGVTDICDLLVPELQRRGLFRTSYDPAEGTLRERYFGAGHRLYRDGTAEP
jgi:FMN-dependent oxidoreductase (nitrilotriacetate monooxygenase family)